MNNNDEIKKILTNKLLPENVRKELLINENHELSSVVLPSERVIKLYSLRLENNLWDERYEEVNNQLVKIIDILKFSGPQKIAIVTIATRNIYILIFANEGLDEIIGILDMTNMGNTKQYTERG